MSDENTPTEYQIGQHRLKMTPRQAEVWNGVNQRNMEGAKIRLGGYWIPLWSVLFGDGADRDLAKSVCGRHADRCDESPCG